jgi:serine/threonine protein kinase
MFNKRINYKEQTGGKLLGSGGYGCVFRPSIACDDGKYSSPSNKYISKVVSNKNIESEFENINTFKLNKIDPNQRFIVYPVENCGAPVNIDIDDHEKCKKSTDDDIDIDGGDEIYNNLIQRYSGKTLDAVRKENPVNDIKKCLLLYLDLFKGVLLLNVNNLAHRDLKPGNIVIDDTGKLRIIDLSLLESTKKPFLHSIENDFNNPEEYLYWDVCFNALTTYPNGGYYKKIGIDVDEKDNNRDKLLILIEYADKFCEKFKGIADTNATLLTGLFQSCIKFLVDIFIHKNIVDKHENLDDIIQSKFDLFMIGIVLLNDITFYKNRSGSDKIDNFLEEFKYLIEAMVDIHVIDRPSLKTVIEMYMELLNKFNDELNIRPDVLETAQRDIDYILKNKKAPDEDKDS